MKYFIFEIFFISIVLFFPIQYVNFNIFIFYKLNEISHLNFFVKNAFMSFPMMNVFIFFVLSIVRKIFFYKVKLLSPVSLRNFLKENGIFLLVLLVFYLKLYQAINETEFIPPDWPLNRGKLLIFFDLISAFCFSAVISHSVLYIKNIFPKD